MVGRATASPERIYTVAVYQAVNGGLTTQASDLSCGRIHLSLLVSCQR
jgi:hypothetical protein